MNRLLLLAAATVFAGASARAADQALLDTLVKKGTLTQAEADAISAAKPKDPAPVAITGTTTSLASKITVSGFVQGRYTGIIQNEKGAARNDPASTNGFSARRVLLNFDAELKGGWGLFISPEMDGAPNPASGNTASFYLDKAGVRYTAESGTAVGGLKKVNFGLEEYGSSLTALVVERSMASQYLATNNFASRHIGLFWDSKQPKEEGVFYGAALTNASVNSTAPNATNNEFAIWANAGYNFTCPLTGAKAAAGLNTGYIGDMAAVGNFAAADSAFGYNPYLTLTKGKFTATAEIIAWHVEFPGNGTDEDLMGYNLTAAYKVTDSVEPVIRFSRLHADATGIANNAAVLNAQAATPATIYEDIWSLYTGVNYYIYGNSLKVQAGYEFSQLTDSAAPGSQIDAHAIRVQIQAAF